MTRLPDLYFAYSSNLDHEDWSRFCRERGFDPGVLRPLGPAILPDELLVFDYRSSRRGCGALNIRRSPGGAVDGYLFAVSGEGWTALDRKEGHPQLYRRETVRTRDPGGHVAEAQTYRVIPEKRIGFCAPSDAYLAVCLAGRARLGLSAMQLEAAARSSPL